MAKPAGYSRTQITLHWLIAILIATQWAFHDLIETAYKAVQKGLAAEGSLHMGHIVIGVSILVFGLWRLFIRSRRGAPDLPPDGNPVLDVIAKWTHWLLYVLMILIPISGIAAWFGGVKSAANAHEFFFSVLITLVILHTAGAIYHQYIKKDGLIGRMMKSG